MTRAQGEPCITNLPSQARIIAMGTLYRELVQVWFSLFHFLRNIWKQDIYTEITKCCLCVSHQHHSMCFLPKGEKQLKWPPVKAKLLNFQQCFSGAEYSGKISVTFYKRINVFPSKLRFFKCFRIFKKYSFHFSL